MKLMSLLIFCSVVNLVSAQMKVQFDGMNSKSLKNSKIDFVLITEKDQLPLDSVNLSTIDPSWIIRITVIKPDTLNRYYESEPNRVLIELKRKFLKKYLRKTSLQ